MGSGVALTYSSEFAPGRLDRPESWNPVEVGLGGWSLDILQHYDAANRVLLGGDGTWRRAEPTVVGGGDFVIPAFDGRHAYVFDSRNRHRRTVDAILGVDRVNFTYDDEGHLSTAIGSYGNTPIDLTVERDSNGQPTGLHGAGGVTTRLVAGPAGLVSAVTDPAGGTTLPFANPAGLVTLYVDRTGAANRFAYDDMGRLASWTDADGVVTSYARTSTADAVKIELFSALGLRWTFTSRDVEGTIERSYVTPDGTRTLSITAANGNRTVSFPDGTELSFGVQPDPRWGLSAPVFTPVVERRPDGVMRRAETAQVVEQLGGDLLRPASWSRTTDVDGEIFVERYDAAAKSVTLTDPAGRRTTQTYDGTGRVVSYRVPGQPAVALAYDGRGRLASETRGDGADAATTSYAYDDATGWVSITGPDGVTQELVVDAAGRIVQITSGDGSTQLVDYDRSGRPVLVRPGSHPATTLGYSAAGRPIGYLPPPVPDDFSYESSSHDQDGRLVDIAGPGDRHVSFAYDQDGRIGSWSFDRGQVTAGYDAATGLLARLAAPPGLTTSFAHVADTLTGITWSGAVTGSVAVTLDSQRRVIAQSVNDAPAIASVYDAGGALIRRGATVLERDQTSGLAVSATLGVAQTTWQYNADGLVTAQSTLINGTPALVLRYEYDALGRIRAVTESDAGGAERRIDYGYDEAGRLASVIVDGVVVERNTYDADGNRVSSGAPEATLDAVFDARGRLMSWGDVVYGYQPAGTLARRVDESEVTAYDFDDLGSLRRAVLPDGRQIEYLVDGAGRRVGRIVDGALVAGYLYLPDGLVAAELDHAGRVVAQFAYDDRRHLVSVDRDGRSWAIVTDHLGSPRLIIDAQSGDIVEAISYDAWGRIASPADPSTVPFGFAGGMLDPDTGLMHFGARDYDPRVGRWTAPDPIRFRGGDTNFYSYLGGDPVNGTDRSGLGPDLNEFPAECAANPRLCSGYPPEPDLNEFPAECAANPRLCGGYPPEPDLNEFPAECAANPRLCSGYPPETPPADTQPGAGSKPPPANGNSWGCVGILVSCTGPDAGCFLALSCHRTPVTFSCVGLACRPPGGGLCVGYCSIGDPHIRTADRIPISFQGAGEYQMLASSDGTVVIQARQEPPGDATFVTITTAVAAYVAGDRVGVYLDSDVALTVNGEAVAGTDTRSVLPGGGSVTRHGTSFAIEWPDGSRLDVDRRGSHLDYGFLPDPALAPTLTGLMGTPDGDVTNDLMSRDGALRLGPTDPDFFDQLHGPFGDSWRITQDESLFDYAPGETSATFTRLDLPTQPATIQALEPGPRAAAEDLCRAAGVRSEPTLSDCIVDVAATADSSYAASAAAVEAATAVGPPSVHGVTAITIGAVVTGEIRVEGERHRYTFEVGAPGAIILDAYGACVDGLEWLLLGPGGEHLLSGLTCNDLGPWALSAPGSYAIEIYSGTAATGAYGFGLRAGP